MLQGEGNQTVNENDQWNNVQCTQILIYGNMEEIRIPLPATHQQRQRKNWTWKSKNPKEPQIAINIFSYCEAGKNDLAWLRPFFAVGAMM
jgi:hypothetical protein